MKVIVKAPALSMSGYGEQARFVLENIKDREDIDLYLKNIPWGKTGLISHTNPDHSWVKNLIHKTIHLESGEPEVKYDVSIQITIPNEWEDLAEYNIGHTAGIEVDRVSPTWIEIGNAIDKIVTISKHSHDVYKGTSYHISNEKTGEVVGKLALETDIDYVGYSTRNISDGDDLDIDFETEFNFLSMCQLGPRKNLRTLVKAFVSKFHSNENVGLVLKTQTMNTSTIDKTRTRNQLKNILSKYKNRKCKIYLIHGDMDPRTLSRLYTHKKIKSFVTTTHGEGFGLPLFEAACNALPIIAPDWSGHRDFLHATVKERKKSKGKVKVTEKQQALFCKIPHSLSEIPKQVVWPNVMEAGSLWCSVKQEDVSISMGKVYSNYESYKKKAILLREHNSEKFHPGKIKEELNEALFSGIPYFQSSEDRLAKIRSMLENIKNPKERAAKLREEMSNLDSQKEKLALMKGLFKDSEAYILSCGPTLMENNLDKLNELISENLCLGIKQTYELFSDNMDFHVYNCNNFKKYSYNDSKRPIVFEASTTPYRLNDCDIKCFIKERDFNKSVSALGNIDDWTFDKQPLLRPYGPGMMFEIVFYLIEHLGFKKITTVGWDNTLTSQDPGKQHFYDMENSGYEKSDFIEQNEVAEHVPIENLQEEEEITNSSISLWLDWLVSSGCEVNICSSLSKAPSSIPRINIK